MEIQILNWINENLHGSSFFNTLFKYITYLGEDGIAWALLGVLLLCFKRTRKAGLLVLGGFCAVVVVNHFVLKNIINKPRPFTESEPLAVFINSIGMELPTSSSFPSGHTTISITSAVILIMCFGKKGLWSLIPAVLISISRIFLCVHYPSDVLAGVTEGVILAVLVVFFGKKIFNKCDEWYLKRKKVHELKQAEVSNTKEEKATNEKAESGVIDTSVKQGITENKEVILQESLEKNIELTEEVDEVVETLDNDGKKEN